MTNLSLARIMYGTAEDFHAGPQMSAPASSSFVAPSASANPAQTSSSAEPGTLGKLFRKAWRTFSRH